MRELFTVKAYKVFTIDKLIQTTAWAMNPAPDHALTGAIHATGNAVSPAIMMSIAAIRPTTR